METLARDFILQAIKEGIEEAPLVYANRLEQRLAFDVQLQEAEGNVADILEEQITDDVLLYCDINEETGEITFNQELFEEEAIPYKAAREGFSTNRGYRMWQRGENRAIDARNQTMVDGYNSGLETARKIDANKAIDADNATRAAAYKDNSASGSNYARVRYETNKAFDKGVNAVQKAASATAAHVTANRGAYALGAAGAALAGAGIYAAYKYLNSPKKIQGAIQKSQARLATAKKENDQKTAMKMEKKLKVLNAKMDALRKKGKA